MEKNNVEKNEEKEVKKKGVRISLKVFIIIISIITVLIITFIIGYRILLSKKENKNRANFTCCNEYENYNMIYYHGFDKVLKNDYIIIENKQSLENLEKKLSVEKEEIEEYNDDYFVNKSSLISVEKEGIKEYNDDYFENKSLLIIDYFGYNRTQFDSEISDMSVKDDTINVKIFAYEDGIVAGGVGNMYFIEIDKNIKNVNIEFSSELSPESNFITYPVYAAKPIIYLYPEEETNVNVKLNRSDKITCSYPKYTTGWNVLAKPNGNLRDLNTNRELYSLYYESENIIDFNITDEGFVISGEESSRFLEEKLALLGLNEREAEEFIIYWLPKLESNKYNYIRFATMEEINENMPLEITPTPNTTIRILMIFKGLEEKIDVKEQKIVTPTRDGFVAVEWGGTEIKQ